MKLQHLRDYSNFPEKAKRLKNEALSPQFEKFRVAIKTKKKMVITDKNSMVNIP